MAEPTSEIEKVQRNIEALEEEIAGHSVRIIMMVGNGESTKEAEAVVEAKRVRLSNLRRYLAKLTGE